MLDARVIRAKCNNKKRANASRICPFFIVVIFTVEFTVKSATQTVSSFKVFARISHQLAISGVINAFNADNFIA